MKFLITGGSGFLGINLTRYLLNKNHPVVEYDLASFDYPEMSDPRVSFVKGDIRDKAKLLEAMRGVDIVVHTAAALPLYTPEDIRTTDIDGTRNVIEAAYETKVQRVIHISSTAVYGIPDHHPLIETDKLFGVGPYGEAKIAAEQMCLDYRTKGMCIPIIRPKSFVGPERLGVFAMLYDWPTPVIIFRYSAMETTHTSISMSKICAQRSIYVRRCRARRPTILSTSAPKSLAR